MSLLNIMQPKPSSEFVMGLAKHVKILDTGIDYVSKLIYNNIVKNKDFFNMTTYTKHVLNPSNMDEAAMDWVFFLDVLNFSFWSDNNPKPSIEYNGEIWTGYYALCAATKKALDNGIPLCTPKFYASINREDLANILKSDNDTEIPLIDERLKNLHEAGQVLLQKYQGSFVNMIKKSEKSATKLLNLIVSDIKSFQDIATYNQKTVSFYKRAQILIADIWAACEGKGFGEFYDIDQITMFADYRIPQVLCWLKVIEYSPHLMNLLEKKYLFSTGDSEEIELRAASIKAVDVIVNKVKQLLIENNCLSEISKHEIVVNSCTVDFYLWQLRRDNAKECEHIPFHRCRSIYY